MGLSRIFGRNTDPATQEKLPDGEPRLPPGQYLTKKWPILSYEDTPRFNAATYRFKVWGAVEEPIELTWDELQALPRTKLTTDIHCVTTWSRFDNDWEGISVREILQRVKPKPEAHFVVAHSFSSMGYTTNMPLADFDDDDVMIAFKHDGEDLTPDHGGPVRLLVPKLYFYKSAKWLSGLEFLVKDRPGFWEVRGYHNHADPWREERYW